MKRSARLDTLVKLAAMAERASRLRLARANQEQQRKLAQRRQLETYDLEYARRWLEDGRAGVSAHRLQQVAAFRDSLAHSVELQREVERLAREGLQRDAGQWRGSRERLRVLARLQRDALASEDREQERRAQRVLDDMLHAVRREPRGGV